MHYLTIYLSMSFSLSAISPCMIFRPSVRLSVTMNCVSMSLYFHYIVFCPSVCLSVTTLHSMPKSNVHGQNWPHILCQINFFQVRKRSGRCMAGVQGSSCFGGWVRGSIGLLHGVVALLAGDGVIHGISDCWVVLYSMAH